MNELTDHIYVCMYLFPFWRLPSLESGNRDFITAVSHAESRISSTKLSPILLLESFRKTSSNSCMVVNVPCWSAWKELSSKRFVSSSCVDTSEIETIKSLLLKSTYHFEICYIPVSYTELSVLMSAKNDNSGKD